MRMREARALCPDIPGGGAAGALRCCFDCIMSALTSVTPDVEVFSVDEAFLDITKCHSLGARPNSSRK